ncbi:MAG: hypothetical protein AAF402_11525 [Pseudomonadota bacterium]
MSKAVIDRSDAANKVFIPITDEMLYKYPELITSPLRPYQIDDPCFHWLGVEIEPPVEDFAKAS